MRNVKPPFKFDLRKLLTRARQQINDRVSGVSINLPFLTFSVQPEATETKVAKEIVIRLADRRVLNAFECCDTQKKPLGSKLNNTLYRNNAVGLGSDLHIDFETQARG